MLILHVRLLVMRSSTVMPISTLPASPPPACAFSEAADHGVGKRVGPVAADLLALVPLGFIDRATGQPGLALALPQAVDEGAFKDLAGPGEDSVLRRRGTPAENMPS